MDPLEALADSVLGHGLVQSIGHLLTLGARDNSPPFCQGVDGRFHAIAAPLLRSDHFRLNDAAVASEVPGARRTGPEQTTILSPAFAVGEPFEHLHKVVQVIFRAALPLNSLHLGQESHAHRCELAMLPAQERSTRIALDAHGCCT